MDKFGEVRVSCPINMYVCVICNTECKVGKNLSNGQVYHEACYNELLNEIQDTQNKGTELQNNIAHFERYIAQRNSEIRRLELKKHSIINKIKCFIFGLRDDKTIENVIKIVKEKIKKNQVQIEDLKKNILQLKSVLEQKNNLLTELYDYWPEYPPDWDRRKLFGDRCERCNTKSKFYHTHHKIRLSKGGNHKPENLELLCESCHSKTHGGKEFSYSESEEESYNAFVRRLDTIKEAIKNGKIIQFSYTKFNGERSFRSIKPVEIQHVGESLCVSGFCYLRKADRTFAIKRMQRVKIVEQPGKCYEEPMSIGVFPRR